MERRTALAEIAEEFDATIPPLIRTTVVAIHLNPLWRARAKVINYEIETLTSVRGDMYAQFH